jgi:hypothetical protein
MGFLIKKPNNNGIKERPTRFLKPCRSANSRKTTSEICANRFNSYNNATNWHHATFNFLPTLALKKAALGIALFNNYNQLPKYL